jgi:hypothetical protein
MFQDLVLVLVVSAARIETDSAAVDNADDWQGITFHRTLSIFGLLAVHKKSSCCGRKRQWMVGRMGEGSLVAFSHFYCQSINPYLGDEPIINDMKRWFVFDFVAHDPNCDTAVEDIDEWVCTNEQPV